MVVTSFAIRDRVIRDPNPVSKPTREASRETPARVRAMTAVCGVTGSFAMVVPMAINIFADLIFLSISSGITLQSRPRRGSGRAAFGETRCGGEWKTLPIP